MIASVSSIGLLIVLKFSPITIAATEEKSSSNEEKETHTLCNFSVGIVTKWKRFSCYLTENT
jgi:hypothetical protein